MAIADLVTATIHVLFAGLWTGSVMFVALAGLPAGGVDRLRLLSRTSALVLLLTGGHLAAARYGGGALTGTARGWAVIAMVVLWLALGGLVEVAASRHEDGGPAAAAPLFRAGGAVAALLLVDAGLLAGGL